MLEHWIQPNHKNKKESYFAYQLGHHIIRYQTDATELTDIQVALIGLDEYMIQPVRQALYDLSYPFGKLQLADLGNIRSRENDFITQVIKELLDSAIIPIIISDDPHFVIAQYRAYFENKSYIHLVSIDDRIAYDQQRIDRCFYLNPLFKHSDRHHLKVIGYQNHFANPEIVEDLKEKHHECIRLGKAKSNLADLEPAIREANMLAFNLSAIKQIEAPAQLNGSAAGFFMEEACQISRYAGMSDKLTSIGFHGYQPQLDKEGQTAAIMAQLIWYFLDGVYNRTADYPISTHDLTQYLVEVAEAGDTFTFWKSNKSGRWWLQLEIQTTKGAKNILYPCSYNDYKQACSSEVSDRILNALRRFS